MFDLYRSTSLFAVLGTSLACSTGDITTDSLDQSGVFSLDIYPASLAFYQDSPRSVETLDVRVQNTGEEFLEIVGLHFSDTTDLAFTLDEVPLEMNLEPGDEAHFTVNYAPGEVGYSAHGALLVSTDINGLFYTIELIGEYVGPEPDQDGDGYDGAIANGPDCDDQDPTIHPDALETWYDGIDQDCDGADDYDRDGDGFVPDEFLGLYTLGLDWTGGLPGGDCDDLISLVHPDAEEVWYDGIDQNCDFADDFDQDGDGYASDQDCDDSRGDVFPEAAEIWYDGIDQDCDGSDDFDQDRDGYVIDADCDDGDASSFPGASGWTMDCQRETTSSSSSSSSTCSTSSGGCG